MKYLIDTNKKYWAPYIILNILLMFFDSIGIIVTIILGKIVDQVLIGNKDGLIVTSIFLILFALFKICGAYFTVIKLDQVCSKIYSGVKEKVYAQLNKMDKKFYEKNNSGELMTVLTTDLIRFRDHIAYTIKTIGAIILTFILAITYLLYLNPLLCLIILSPAIVIGIYSIYFVRKVRPKYIELRASNSNVNNFIGDNIEANKVVKSFALEKDEINKMRKINGIFIKNDYETGLEENKYFTGLDFLTNLMNFLFILFGSILFINNQITIGGIIIFYSLLSDIRSPFSRLGDMANRIQRYLISKDKIIKILKAKPTLELNGTIPLSSLLKPIVFKSVTVKYDDQIALKNISIEIKPYETVAFIGSTGSGKSSIANVLLGFVKPIEGEVLLDKNNFFDYSIKDIRKHIGYVMQSPFLFSETIFNNVNYGIEKLSEEGAYHYLDLACVNYVDKLPQKIDTVIGERGVGLSGGEKQRLSLARALAVQPDLLLLDDITSALDIETEEKITDNINNLHYKCTKVIIADKIISVMNANYIYVLDKGKIIEEGTHKQLLEKKGYYYELNMIQKGNII